MLKNRLKTVIGAYYYGCQKSGIKQNEEKNQVHPSKHLFLIKIISIFKR